LIQNIHVAVFAVDVNYSLRVDGERVDAPLVTVGMVLVDGRVLETPFRLQIGADLRYVIWPGRKRLANRAVKVAIQSARVSGYS
jgi:hypothetical protein